MLSCSLFFEKRKSMKKYLRVITALLFTAGTMYSFTLKKYGEFHFERYNDNVYIMHGPVVAPDIDNGGFMNNPAIIEGKKGLIVIDPGGNYNVGKKVLSEIEKVSKKPILATINTHKHGDHWFANKAILEKYPKLKIYAHENMIREVKAGEAQKWYEILDRLTKNLKGTDKAFAYPNHALKDGDKIEIDTEKFVVFHPAKAHTDTDLMILHLNSQTLFLGDNVMKGRIGAFDGSSSIFGNIALLEKVLMETNYKLYVPGHGISGKRDETVKPYLFYLKTVTKWAQKAYDDDKESYEVKADAEKALQKYKKWDGFSYALGRHLMKAYQEIEMQEVEEE